MMKGLGTSGSLKSLLSNFNTEKFKLNGRSKVNYTKAPNPSSRQNASYPVQHDFSKPHFVNLPRELRDEIYKLLYRSCVHIWEAPPVYEQSKPLPQHYIRLTEEGQLCKGGSFYPISKPRYSLLAMLHLNRQIRAEFLEFLENMRKAQPELQAREGGIAKDGLSRQTVQWRYDISVRSKTDWKTFEPKWLILPIPPEGGLPTVDVLRIRYYIDVTSPEDIESLEWYYIIADRPPPAFAMFFRFLSDLFNHGPQFLFNGNLANRVKQMKFKHVTIQLLFFYTPEMLGLVRVLDCDYEIEMRAKQRLENRVRANENTIGNYFNNCIADMVEKGLFSGRAEDVEIILGYWSSAITFHHTPDPNSCEPSDWRGWHWGTRPLCRADGKICHCKWRGKKDKLPKEEDTPNLRWTTSQQWLGPHLH